MIWASTIHKSWKKYEVEGVLSTAQIMYIYYGLDDVAVEFRLKSSNDTYWGLCEKESSKHIIIRLYHSNDFISIIETVQHEMTHAKQFAFKELKNDFTWKGSSKWKNTKYWKQPWEIEAQIMEGFLTNKC